MSDNVLSIQRKTRCQHNQFLVDETLAYVECGLCGEQLSPMWVLRQLCNDEARAWNRLQDLEKKAEAARERNRCKCEHCKKMTKICK